MKNYIVSLALGLMMIAGLSSCFHHRHDISISVSDDEDEYEMEADYRRNQSHAVQVYLNNNLLNNSNVSIQNGFVDDEVTLDDKTTFYINTNPGELSIRINKNENTEESCERVRQACEELKQILADN
ncbi:MAG: hypothetical protein IPO01_05050 [Chitinophagaceae bacterium]|nr:hypothetical protein [Chitinophagaceae bacterium]MBK9484585.1 hypothetical protein [Chitinophagaceae bacterium]MBL0199174.1 hypothetical protein [Chitinophagaceae bacterium]